MSFADDHSTHIDADKMADISQETISNVFFEWMCILINIPLKFVPKGETKHIPAGDKPLSEPINAGYFTDTCMRHSASMS